MPWRRADRVDFHSCYVPQYLVAEAPKPSDDFLARVTNPRRGSRMRSGRASEEGFQMLACDDAAPADLEVGQLADAYLVIQQVAGQPGDRRGLIDAVGQPLVRFGAGHRFHLDHLAAHGWWSPGVAEDGINGQNLQTARS